MQIGITSAKSLIFCGVLLNAANIALAVLFTCLCIDKLFGAKSASKVLLLCVLNPVYYMMTMWVYTTTFSVSVMMAICYVAACIYKCDSRRTRAALSCVLGLLAAFGLLLRATAFFPVIAAVFCALLSKKLRAFGWRHITALVISFALMFASSFLLLRSYTDRLIVDRDRLFPPTHWLMMGMNPEHNGGFSPQDGLYTSSFPTRQEKISGNLAKIKDRLNKYDLGALAAFLAKKQHRTWGNGTNNYFNRYSPDDNIPALYGYLFDKHTGHSDAFIFYCQIFRLATLVLILLSTFRQISAKAPGAINLFSITLLGGFLFYTFWEVQAAYSVPFLLIMLILAENGLSHLAASAFIRKPLIHRTFNIAAVVLFLATIVISAAVAPLYVKKKYKFRNYSVRFTVGSNFIAREAALIEQSFVISKPFNEVIVYAHPSDKSDTGSYALTLTDPNGAVVVSKTINSRKVKRQIVLRFETQRPIRNGKYTLRIAQDHPHSAPLAFFYRSSSIVDGYAGALKFEGAEIPGRVADLKLSVSHVVKKPYSSSRRYFIFTALILLLELLCLVRLNRTFLLSLFAKHR